MPSVNNVGAASFIAIGHQDHESFIQDVMTIKPASYLKLVAVLHHDSC